MAKRRRKSRGKKIFLIILAILVVLVLAIVGVGAKLYLDLYILLKKLTNQWNEPKENERNQLI
ncbi:hypothetical protein I8F73_00245 [Enterococcus faecalis]|nr:hypothetical protein [Enterococcus faecalis]